jgi:hypothetical protein
MQAPGDHQVQHQPELVLEADGDALAEPPQLVDLLALDASDRRVGGAQQERMADPHARQLPAEDARLQGLDIDRDVRQFGHAGQHAITAFGQPARAGYLPRFSIIFL